VEWVKKIKGGGRPWEKTNDFPKKKRKRVHALNRSGDTGTKSTLAGGNSRKLGEEPREIGFYLGKKRGESRGGGENGEIKGEIQKKRTKTIPSWWTVWTYGNVKTQHLLQGSSRT